MVYRNKIIGILYKAYIVEYMPNNRIQPELKSIQIADIPSQAEYIASIKISRQPNGKILGTSVFIPAEFIEGIVGTADIVKLKISHQNNKIILSL